MANQWPAPSWIDGDFTTAKACGLPVFASPIPSAADGYVFTQDFCQLLTNWSAATYGTAHPSSGKTPDYSEWILINEGPRQDVGGGVIRWTRTYAKLPASYDDWESLSYTFIGSAPGAFGAITSAQVGRLRFSEIVTARVKHDFFIVPSTFTDPITGTAVAATVPGDIPVIRALAYCIQFKYGSPQVQYGGYWYRQDYVCDAAVESTPGGQLYVTTPTATEYAAMIDDATANGWNATSTLQVLAGNDPVLVDLNSTTYGGQFVAEDSKLLRYQGSGNIWERVTRYILAK
jgi:hypothetical protein